MCNLGLSYRKQTDGEVTLSNWDQTVAQRTFEDICSSGTAICHVCSVDLSSDLCEKPEIESLDLRFPFLSQCTQLICSVCFRAEPSADQGTTICEHHPKCRFLPVSSITTADTVSNWDEFSDPPSKLRALMNDLNNVSSDEKRYNHLKISKMSHTKIL